MADVQAMGVRDSLLGAAALIDPRPVDISLIAFAELLDRNLHSRSVFPPKRYDAVCE
jgi:hypothetical protein